MSFWAGFEKRATESVSKEDLVKVLKKHEERETPEQEKAESKEEQEIEREAGVEKHARFITRSELRGLAAAVANDALKDKARKKHVKEAAPARRPMASDITSNPAGAIVVSLNFNDQASKPFVEKLDKALSGASGLEKIRIVALDAMKDGQVIKDLGLSIPSVGLFRRGKKLGTIGAGSTEMQMTKILTGVRKDLI